MAEDAKRKMMKASEKVSALNVEVRQSDERAEEIRKSYQRVLSWSEMFDSSEMAVKKMVAGYIIKRLEVYSGYRLHIEFKINFEQFALGLEIPNDYDRQEKTP